MSKPRGRPSTFTDEIAAEILKRIAMGRSVMAIGKDADMPAAGTIHDWIAKRPDFAEKYARACDERATAIAEETLEIADDLSGKVFSSEDVQLAKLRVDTRKWFASKLAPKKYGDRLGVDANVSVSFADVAAAAAAIRRAGAGEPTE